jgi:preprotein translocase subunit SecG
MDTDIIMQTVIVVFHLMVVVALAIVVLLQRSEGGALGIGGGSNSFMSGRAQANALTKATAILATLFFITSLSLTILARHGQSSPFSLNGKPSPAKADASVLDSLRQIEDSRKAGGAPTQTAPAAAPVQAPTATPAPVANPVQPPKPVPAPVRAGDKPAAPAP